MENNKKTGKIMKKLTAVLLALMCCMLQTPTVYGDEPSGPATDKTIPSYSVATGPGAELEAEQNALEQAPAEHQGDADTQILQETQGGVEQPKEPQESQEPEAKEGLVMSGGRWLDPSKPMIALTFDDGPYDPVGNRIMDCLKEYDGRSTFFVVGNRVSAYRTEVKRMQDEGHEVANHTYDHKNMTKLSAGEIRSQIERCNNAIAAVTGEVPGLVRLPGGSKNGTVLANVDYPIIMWNIDTLDWKTRNAQKSFDAVVGKVRDGDIVLMHEIHIPSGEAAVRIIPALSEQGFQLVTVEELVRFRGGAAAGKVYSRFRP